MKLSLMVMMLMIMTGCRATMMKPTKEDDVREKLQKVQKQLDEKTRRVEELEHDPDSSMSVGGRASPDLIVDYISASSNSSPSSTSSSSSSFFILSRK